MSETPEAGEQDAGVAELVADYLPTDTSSEQTTAEPTATQQTADAPQADATQSAPAPTAAAPTTQEPQRFRIGDREYTQDELNRALITAGKYETLQDKHLRMLEQQRAAAQPQAQQPQTPGLTAKQLHAAYEPAIKRAVANGDISSDFAEAFPAETAGFLFFRDVLLKQQAAINGLSNHVSQRETVQVEDQMLNGIHTSIHSLTAQGEHFAQLADPGEHQKFFDYLVRLNPQIEQFQNPDFLPSQWVAYNKDKYFQGIDQQKQAATAAAQQKQRTRALAVGASSTPRPLGAPQEPSGFWDEDLLRDRFPNMR